MTVSVSLSSFSGTNVSTGITINHAHSGTPKGVLVTIIERAPTGDRISGVTYGGEDLVEVTSGVTTASPIIYTNAEPFTIHYFFLGSGVPAGTQDAVISPSASGGRLCVVTTFDGAADLEINDLESLADTSETDPAYTFGLGGTESLVLVGFGSGYSAVGNISPYTGWSEQAEFDLGSSVAGLYSYDTIGTSDPTDCGYNTVGSDDVSLSAIAINEISGGAITGTGVLTSAVSTASGSGDTFTEITGTGVLNSAVANVSGTGSTIGVTTGTGALTSEVANLSGVGSTFTVLTGTGSLTNTNSLITGTGNAFTTLTGTSTLIAGNSTVAGSGTVLGNITGTGNLQVEDSLLSGTGVSFTSIIGTGDLQPLASSIVGTGVSFSILTGSGSLVATDSTITSAGNAFSSITGSGALNTSLSAINGSGSVAGNIVGSGSLQTVNSALSGVGNRIFSGTGALVNSASTIAGSGVIVGNISGSGSLVNSDSIISGSGSVITINTGTGDLDVSLSIISGTGNAFTTIVGTGNLVSNISNLSGTGTVVSNIVGTGSLIPQNSNVAASGSSFTVITGSGTLVNGPSAIDGSGVKLTTLTGTGSLVAYEAMINGVSTGITAGNGILVSGNSSISGSGKAFTTNIGTGSLILTDSAVAATSNIRPALVGSGSLVSNNATVSGTGVQFTVNVGTGTLPALQSNISGNGVVFTVNSGTGSLNVQSSNISGVGAAISTLTGSGSLIPTNCSISSVADTFTVITGSGSLVPNNTSILGTGDNIPTGNGNLVTTNALVAGSGLVPKKAMTANIEASSSTVLGTGIAYSIITGSGELLSTASVITAELSDADDDLPVPFTFIDIESSEIGTVVESNTVVITGITTIVDITIVGGEYSVNGKAYTALPGYIRNNDTVQVRARVPNYIGTVGNATVSIGAISDTYSITATDGIGDLVSDLPILTTNYGSKSIVDRKYAKVTFPIEDYLEILVKLTKRYSAFTIPESSQVTARLISADRSVTYTPEQIQASNQTQADWSKSVINIIIPEDQLALLDDDTLPWSGNKLTSWLEIEVRDNYGTKTYYISVVLSKYTVD